MRNTMLFAAAAVLGFIPGAVAMQYPIAANAGSRINSLPPVKRTPFTTLYNQNSNGNGQGIDSQNFETATFAVYNDQAADDFIVPAGETWRVEEVDVAGVYLNGTGPPDSMNVYFYKDHHGVPGKLIKGGSFTDLTVEGAGSFAIALPKKLTLKAGHYWVSVQANCSFNICGEWGWEVNILIHNNPAVWENPGGGFGTGCTTWGTLQSCLGTSGDLAFDLRGTRRNHDRLRGPTAPR